ncbi:hypothetical protein JCM5353_007479 [Sporobolomyces roseus]
MLPRVIKSADIGGKGKGREKQGIDSSKSNSSKNSSAGVTGSAHSGMEEEVELRNEVEEELQISVNLPLEVWLLVAEKLDPLSLLYLTRTTKNLYHALTSKQQSKSVWKRSAAILNLPSFQNDDLIGPALISFLYETTCHACGKDEAFEMSYTLLLRWHDQSYCDARRVRAAVQSDISCQKQIFLAEHEITTRIPVIRDEVFGCVPVALEVDEQRPPTRYYDVARLREMNLELLAAIPDGTQDVQQSAVQAFVNSKKHIVRAAKVDGTELKKWWKESVDSRKDGIRTEVLARVGYDRSDSVSVMFQQWRELIDRPYPLTPEERQLLFPAFDDAVNTIFASKRGKKVKADHLAHRLALKSRFDPMIGNLALFPSFPIFTELPSVQKFWKIEDRPSNYAKAWTRELPSITAEIEGARRWIKLTLLRTAAVELARIGQPLPASVISSLTPPKYSSPPARYEGMFDSANSTGVRLDDSASIKEGNLSQRLNFYSMQAFAFPKQQPGDYREILYSRFEAINHPAYQGPLFPRFNSYWHQLLAQVLKAVNLKDGAAKPTAKFLEELGSWFFCGACSNGKTNAGDGMLISALLDHIRRTHPARPTDTPQPSLVLYNEPLPLVHVEVDETAPAVEETARGRRAAARRQ